MTLDPHAIADTFDVPPSLAGLCMDDATKWKLTAEHHYAGKLRALAEVERLREALRKAAER